MTITSESAATNERADLLETLAKHRRLLRHTVRGLTDEQARLRPTASELTLGGLITHVTAAERTWPAFIVGGPPAFRAAKFEMMPGETLEGLLGAHAAVARQTDELVRTLPDLDVSQPLPEAVPWFKPGRAVVRSPDAAAYRCGDRAARRSRRHPAGVHRRPEDDGLTVRVEERADILVKHTSW